MHYSGINGLPSILDIIHKNGYVATNTLHSQYSHTHTCNTIDQTLATQNGLAMKARNMKWSLTKAWTRLDTGWDQTRSETGSILKWHAGSLCIPRQRVQKTTLCAICRLSTVILDYMDAELPLHMQLQTRAYQGSCQGI